MIISIKIENQKDWQWIKPLLEALKKNSSAKVEIQSDANDLDLVPNENRSSFINYISENAKVIEKVQPLNREELHER
ncbi:MAG: hypothetical protein IT270_07945 [Saprospiraceae bacterium]|nr:hypothetical protein [Saprospiraceae bacterium]